MHVGNVHFEFDLDRVMFRIGFLVLGGPESKFLNIRTCEMKGANDRSMFNVRTFEMKGAGVSGQGRQTGMHAGRHAETFILTVFGSTQPSNSSPGSGDRRRGAGKAPG